MSKSLHKRCAIYTRKSSENGLEQEFNSLDAQREACAAYIASQVSEGWRALSAQYDDAGISGGTMDRPGLQRLMADIKRGGIDIVVVYKIDRLTRSLPDFARMVELFEQHGVSFVSITQAFNTTTSMGRLTLNVLLSFAQFEREVTSERIRDKITASKQKGMWMGGVLPLGYDAPNDGTRILRINPAEAETVRMIFTRYLALGSVHALAEELAAKGITSKCYTTRKGRLRGGQVFSRGALFHLLRNRLYLGEIVHKGTAHPGLHEAIIDDALFTKVQQQLDANKRRIGTSPKTQSRFMLTGRIFDAHGHPMSPSTTQGSTGMRYRYYVSAPLQQGSTANGIDPELVQRIAATDIEAVIDTALRTCLCPSVAEPHNAIQRLTLSYSQIEIKLAAGYAGKMKPAAEMPAQELHDDGTITLTLPIKIKPRSGRVSHQPGITRRTGRNEKLIDALKRAHKLVKRDPRGMPVITAAPTSAYERKLIRLVFLSPRLQRQILAGEQPIGMSLSSLLEHEPPLSWAAQEAAYK